MSRKRIAAGNWKMNKNYDEGLALAQAIVDGSPSSENEVVLSPPFIHLKAVVDIAANSKHIKVAAQNCHFKTSGAYTGETSVEMLKSIGVDYVILGHSERRQYFKESNTLLAKKISTVLDAGLLPIFCCGEPLEIREGSRHVEYVREQVAEGLFHLNNDEISKVVIAYEPIWAIGTGKTATPEQAQHMHWEIRDLLASQYHQDIADGASILYGGSVKPANADELFSKFDVDGGLVGGASLKPDDFIAIINAL